MSALQKSSVPAHTPRTLPAETNAAGESTPALDHQVGCDVKGALDGYVLMEPLGRGGMGCVYRAREQALDREVAIKWPLHPNPVDYERFAVEARAAARLEHPNIARVYRFGRWQSGPWLGQPYLVEEYVRGRSLARTQTPMPWSAVLNLAVSLARGLAAAHRRGVLHRDIKPANILLSEGGVPKLIDFGLAKLTGVPDLVGERAPPVTARADIGLSSLTTDGRLMGTPRYVAPEIWFGEPASRRSDIYSLGVVLYQLCGGRTPFGDVPVHRLRQITNEREPPTLGVIAPDIDGRLAAIINHCLVRRPEARFPSADHLRDALEELQEARSHRKPARGEPYPGLQPFDSEHSTFFCGRDSEIRHVINRMRTEPIVLLVGESGVGKSSLLRAGVLPALATAGLSGVPCEVRTMVPGRHPADRLPTALSDLLPVHSVDGSTSLAGFLEGMLDDSGAVVRFLRRQMDDRHTVIFVDQLEELVTLAEPGEAAIVCRVLATLAERISTVRVVATVRADKLVNIAGLPGLDQWIAHGALYWLKPLSSEGLRTIIQSPARAKGVRFAPALVDTLVQATASARGGLPLLQFALSRLWAARDENSACIPESALATVGGVEGALSRHADGVLDAMLPDTRRAARNILLHLVTSVRTRARYTHEELTESRPSDEAALATLVDGRLVVACADDGQTTYELAHEALITGWTRLRHWLDREGGIRAVKERLSDAAVEWQRVGRSRDALWRGPPLVEAGRIRLDDLPSLERAFLSRSRLNARRTRWLRLAAVMLPLCLAMATWAAVEYREQREVAQDVARSLRQSQPHLSRARTQALAFMAARQFTVALFKHGDGDIAERVWKWALTRDSEADRAFVQAGNLLLQAWLRDPGHPETRNQWSALASQHAQLAHVAGRFAQREQLLETLAMLDGQGQRLARWRSPVRLRACTGATQVTVALYRYHEYPDGRLSPILVDEGDDSSDECVEWSVEPDSYLVLVKETYVTAEVRYPVLIEPVAVTGSSARTIELTIPLLDRIPAGFVYVPGGSFLFGHGRSEADELARNWYRTLPAHKRTTRPFIIARHETTFSEWMEFLRTEPMLMLELLPSSEEQVRQIVVALQEAENDEFALRFGIHGETRVAREGEAFDFPGRAGHSQQRWERFPVLGATPRSIQRYIAWLGRTGRVPGARLCREDEWEHAARGADGRRFPHGNLLRPGDANFDDTHGKDGSPYGPDEIGMHPASVSPFGLQDTAGNACEITESSLASSSHGRDESNRAFVMRGGGFFFSYRMNALVNREPMALDDKPPYAGFRVCADWPQVRTSDGVRQPEKFVHK